MVRRGRPPQGLPTARSIRLGRELRLLREACDRTQDEVARHLGTAGSKISRIESGHRQVTHGDLTAMLRLYGLTEPDQRWTWLTALAREVTRRDWWDDYSDLLPAEFATYLALEDAAARLSIYEPLVVPGLLQTPDYAHALITANSLGPPSPELDRLVQVRMQRRATLTRQTPLRLDVVLDESVLHRHVGGAAVMRAQIEYLTDAGTTPTIHIRVLPHRAGAYPGMVTSFTLLSYSADADDQVNVVCMENLASSLYVEDLEHIQRYSQVYARMRTLALDPTASADLMADLARNL